MQTAAMGGATGVRIADGLVHRRSGPWTPAVHDLLRHLRADGFDLAPEVVGFDDEGDEVLRFIEGDNEAWPLSDARLAALGRVAREVRDRLAAYPAADDERWRSPAGGSTLVHGDIAPWNAVFRGDDVVALLDWDLAGLASELYDLGYLAWTAAPLDPQHDVAFDERCRRLRLLVEAFGATDDERAALLTHVAYAQTRVAFLIGRGGMTDELGMPGLWRDGRRVGELGRSMAWLHEHWDALAEVLR